MPISAWNMIGFKHDHDDISNEIRESILTTFGYFNLESSCWLLFVEARTSSLDIYLLTFNTKVHVHYMRGSLFSRTRTHSHVIDSLFVRIINYPSEGQGRTRLWRRMVKASLAFSTVTFDDQTSGKRPHVTGEDSFTRKFKPDYSCAISIVITVLSVYKMWKATLCTHISGERFVGERKRIHGEFGAFHQREYNNGVMTSTREQRGMLQFYKMREAQRVYV